MIRFGEQGQANTNRQLALQFSAPADGTVRKRRLHALYLLSQFMYFGAFQIRELTRVLFRDLFKYPLVAQIREANGHTTDLSFIEREFSSALERTRFLGLGNVSESGTLLLYYFRQVNELQPNYCITTNEISHEKDVDRYVFIDDFCGSGHQAIEYSADIVDRIKNGNSGIEVYYFVLCGMTEGLSAVKKNAKFDRVECIFELDDSFRTFSSSSRYFPSPGQPQIIAQFAREMCIRYGLGLLPSSPLGYDNCQLLLGFQHNTPDNTLPVFWSDGSAHKSWIPIFKRFSKKPQTET